MNLLSPRFRSGTLATLLLCASPSVPTPICAQAGTQSCPGCWIELSESTSLRPSAGGFPVSPTGGTLIEPGLILISFLSANAPPVAFDLQGGQVEFFSWDEAPREPAVFVRGHGPPTLHLLSQRMFLVFSEKGVFSESLPVPVPFSTEIYRMGKGEYLLHAVENSPRMVGQPFHLFNSRGSHIRSFGGSPRPYFPALDDPLLQRFIAPESDSTFWALSPAEHRLSRWTLSGERTASFRVADSTISEEGTLVPTPKAPRAQGRSGFGLVNRGTSGCCTWLQPPIGGRRSTLRPR